MKEGLLIFLHNIAILLTFYLHYLPNCLISHVCWFSSGVVLVGFVELLAWSRFQNECSSLSQERPRGIYTCIVSVVCEASRYLYLCSFCSMWGLEVSVLVYYLQFVRPRGYYTCKFILCKALWYLLFWMHYVTQVEDCTRVVSVICLINVLVLPVLCVSPSVCCHTGCWVCGMWLRDGKAANVIIKQERRFL